MAYFSILSYLVLITVNKVKMGIVVKLFRHFVKSGWLNDIVAVHKYGKLAVCCCKTVIRGCGDMTVFGSVYDLYSAVRFITSENRDNILPR